MQYQEVYQDLFTVDKSFYLAHCIASDFRMGAGIAVKFQKKFGLRDKLKHINGDTSPGTCALVGKVFNLITKSKSSGKPTYKTLESSLVEMKRIAELNHIDKIAMPKIGCGLDRLQWGKVREIIQEVFNESVVEIVVCTWR